PCRPAWEMGNMHRVIALSILVAGLAAPPLQAQVYPERMPSVTRGRAERVAVERYQRGGAREEQTERFTRTLRVDSGGEIDLGNIAGDIVVTRGGGNEATLEVVKTARGRTVEEAREMLSLVQVDVSERGGRSEVRVRYPRDENRRNRRNVNVSVDFTLTAPEQTRLTVNSISGSISVRDIKGELALETISGSLRIANAGQVPKAKTVSGDVEIADTTLQGALDAATISGTLTLRKVQAARLDLGSVSGDVVIQDVQSPRVRAQSISGEVQLAGALQRGSRYDLSSHSGQVRVLVGGDVGFDLEASSFSGSVRTDLPLTSQTTDREGRRGQRSLRGTYGDGSATLDLTTFSGNISIGKR
ncbi:MAG TPA: DUF4097 family beta strand repeat-containing protein, partial [Vicinamibacterales bacterium]|nr:DUF4097 family beta strand repeat-containing protein [Vicinamibacterales bacterium]